MNKITIKHSNQMPQFKDSQMLWLDYESAQIIKTQKVNPELFVLPFETTQRFVLEWLIRRLFVRQ